MGYLMEMYDAVYVCNGLENMGVIVYAFNRLEIGNDKCMSKLIKMHVL